MIDKVLLKLLGYGMGIKSNKDLRDIIMHSRNGFDIIKLEKDFYLTVILNWISKKMPIIHFKGGTCLNKMYFPYFRLSEDLDFGIQYDGTETGGTRRDNAYAMRDTLKEFCDISGFQLIPENGYHAKARGLKRLEKVEYSYLKYTLHYKSIFDNTSQTIKVELTACPKLYKNPVMKEIHAIYKDPLLEKSLFQKQSISCFAIEEMIAEKCRAALTRHIPAIRDFYDLRYISEHKYKINTDIDLIQAKCSEVINDRFTIDEAYEDLKKQVETDLKPVLKDTEGFDLDNIYSKLMDLKRNIE